MTNLLELGHQIAAALGPGWSAERGYMIQAHAILRGPGDQALSIRHGDASHRRSEHGRLQISPDYGELNRHLNSGEGPTTITVAADRSHNAIAAEITRRLLPAYTTTLGLCRTRQPNSNPRAKPHATPCTKRCNPPTWSTTIGSTSATSTRVSAGTSVSCPAAQ
ncbi:hypothetical protein ACIBCD_42680 [Nocardia brasiliensis]|uniref:hypothetical protein n=1 Tax=Nocardia brasiliensis TaxID=37326 RepID=UPI0037AC3D3C